MIALGLTTFLVTTLVAGFGVTMLLLRSPARLNAIECVCLSWLFGAGSISLSLWAAGRILHGVALPVTIGILCLALGIYGWIRVRSREVTLLFRRPSGILERLLLTLLVLGIVLAFFASWKNPLGWDGSFNWENKARIAFLSGGSIPAGYYSSNSQTLSHPEYPLLIPFTELWLYLCLGESHQFLAKIIFPIFYAGAIGLIAVIGARLSGRVWAGMAAAALLFFIPVLVRHSGGVASGYVDLPLSVLYLAAIGYLVLFQNGRDPNMFRLSAGALALLPWIKAEGTIVWFAGAICALVICWRQKKWWMGVAGVLPGATLAAIWRIFLYAMSTQPPHDFVKVSAATLWTNIDRAPAIALAVLKELARLNDWSFFWILVAAAVVYQLVRKRDSQLFAMAAGLVLPIAAYSFSYIFSTWPDFRDHMIYSLARLLLHVTPIGCLLIALALPPPGLTTKAPSDLSAKTI